MTTDDTRVIDVDAHYVESLEATAEYMADPWKTRILEGGDLSRSAFFPRSSGERYGWGRMHREHASYPPDPMAPEEVPEAMDHLGVDAIVLISHFMLAMANLNAEDDRMVEFARGHTQYLLNHVVNPDRGIYAGIALPHYDVDASLELLDRIADEPGIVAAVMITAGSSPPLGHRRYDPIYEACEDAGLPVMFHTGGSGLDEYVRRGYEKFIETHTLGFLESNMAQLTSLVIQGFPEKFQDLDAVFVESGILYVPAIMYRLDEEYLKRPDEAPLLRKRPSEYVGEFYFGTQPLEYSTDVEFLEFVIDRIGVDQLVYASDYPHWDYDRPAAVDRLSFLTDQEKGRILGANAAEVFDI